MFCLKYQVFFKNFFEKTELCYVNCSSQGFVHWWISLHLIGYYNEGNNHYKFLDTRFRLTKLINKNDLAPMTSIESSDYFRCAGSFSRKLPSTEFSLQSSSLVCSLLQKKNESNREMMGVSF